MASDAPINRIVQLSTIISENTTLLNAHLQTNKLSSPSFSQDSPASNAFPPEIEVARSAVEEATLELHDLVRGPRSILMDSPNHYAARAFIAQFDVAAHVPVESSISYAELASKIGVAESAVQTMLRLAISHRIFLEPSPGHVAHSAASRMLHDDETMRKFFLANSEFFPIAINLVPALQQFPAADNPTQTAAALTSGTVGEKGFYEVLAEHPQRAENFHAAMKLFAMDPGLSMKHVLNAYDWGSLPNEAVCVDLGGGEGEAAITVAREHSHVRWEVQDLPNAFANLPPLPEEVKGRVVFRAHDFFTPQPSASTPASVFFFRWILHNHSDAECHRILRALIPSLNSNPKAKIVVMDGILPPMNLLPNTAERVIRSMDVTMMELGNGRERGEDAWRQLFVGADQRFVVENIAMPEGSRLGAVVVGWRE